MGAADHEGTLRALEEAARVWAMMTLTVSEQEIVDAQHTVEQADAFGPIFDPTAWIKQGKRGGLERQRRLLSASLAYRRALTDLFPDLAALEARDGSR